MSAPSQASKQVATLFDSVASTYESVGVRWFVPIAERLVDEVNPHIGAHVLDVGCGRGAALPSLAAAVGHVGRVVGIDLSPKMLDLARRAVELRGLHNVDLYVRDAAAPDLPRASFDHLVSSLVLFFLPDPAAALRAWHDLLVPTGTLGLTTFGEQDADWQEADEVFLPYLPAAMQDPRVSGRHGPYASDDGMVRLVADAGFERVRTVRWRQEVVFESPEQWRSWSMSHGQRRMWMSVPEGARDEVHQRIAEILQRRNGPGLPITVGQTIRLTMGVRTLSG